MKIAVFDPFSGVSGNMVLGALIQSGLDAEELLRELKKLPVSNWEMKVSSVTRGGLSGTLVEITASEEKTHRHLSDIRKIINDSLLPEPVKTRALNAFLRLAQCEAAAHGTDSEQVTFHEVGAIDAVIDIIGSFLGLHMLGIKRVYSSPVAVGSGTVRCAHGVIPVPSPATVRLLQGAPLNPTSIPAELTTPTGAAILASAVDYWEGIPSFRILACGMGAGSRENPERANLIRVTIGEVTEHVEPSDYLLKIETLVDDLDFRIWPELSSDLLASGAVDCYSRQCLGKKCRPALELVVLLHPSDRENILNKLFSNSSTLGVRISTVSRVVLKREFQLVTTSCGEISVKLGYYHNRLVSAEPEFDSCLKLAEKTGTPVKLVLQEAKGCAMKLIENSSECC
ncbi:TIGR00299 family protein [Candidatus Fermentibacteria bacterium]|nr:MAG: TIGR00299 family protein [Candidatus Fermentibacteria bacterium]